MNPSGKKQLSKTYNPAEFEIRIYNQWENSGAFKPQGKGDAYTIMMPPPNITGKLHMGHALNMTLQDIMARFKRQQGKAVLWQAGIDHAGIATQAVVERELLKSSNQSRQELGRAAFEKKVWEWKASSGDDIVHQLKRLGASCDWDAARFTLDEGMSQAVRFAFVEFYKKGLIYRAERLVNWDVKLKTAISDLEVSPREVKGHLWHLRYELENGSGDIVVATTRPETMLGDCAVAVHPQDERYKNLVGKNVLLPLVGRVIPIIADDYVNPKQGSGAVKITPAHDFNDFEVGARHNLTPINILDESGALLEDEIVPAAYRGLSCARARRQIVADLEKAGRLEKIENIKHSVPYGERSNEIVEPFLTKQWFVDAEKLAGRAIKAVENGETKFVPQYWEKTYFEWLRNIKPWCISRQLWWGHRIPVWYDEAGKAYVAMTLEAAQAQAGEKKLSQDEDVLDTWFSSGLWAFSTLGWRNEAGGNMSAKAKENLARYYPTQLLITGLDIIFFWVARMMMMSCYFMAKPPFKDIYIHALVRDVKGQKMTKSRGNVVDPLELMDKYGADALRFTMAAMASAGQDVKLSEERVKGYRNFATKLWNAARFGEMNDCSYEEDFDFKKVKNITNKWIVARLEATIRAVKGNLESYQFNLAAETAYDFVWHDFCDWYLEFAKVNLTEMKKEVRLETQKTLAFVLKEILIMLHPFMPFITEELWQRDSLLVVEAGIPALDNGINEDSRRISYDINLIFNTIKEIRRWRDIFNKPYSVKINLFLDRKKEEYMEGLKAKAIFYFEKYLPKIVNTHFCEGAPPPLATKILFGITSEALYLDFGDAIDIEAAKIRKKNALDKALKKIKELKKKLENKNFCENADKKIIAAARDKFIDIKDEATQHKEDLDYLNKIS